MGALDLLTANFNGRLIFSVSLVAVSAANYGFDNQGFSAAQAMTPFEKQFGYFDTTGTYAGTYQLQTSWLSLYSSVIWVGFAVGLVVGSEISARWGRRVGMLALSLWAIISSTIIVSSYSKWQILVGRILFNGYMGMELSVLPVYQAEVVPTPVRGLTVSTYQFVIQIGGLIMNLIALGTAKIPNNASWRIPFGLFYVAPAIVIAGLHWVPESPRWLLVNDRRDEALINLRLLRQGKRSEEEIVEELKTIEIALAEEPEKGRFMEIFLPQNIRRTMIACGVNFFQEMSGQQITSKFGALIVKDVGGIDPFVITVIFAVTSIIIILFVMAFTDRIGRKPFLMASMMIMSGSAFGLGAIGTYDYTTRPPLAATAIFFLVMLSCGFAVGYGPLTNVIMTEVVSLRLRDVTQRTAGFSRVISNIIVGVALPYQLATIGLQLGWLFACINLVALAFTYFCVPECRGKSLETVEHLFQEHMSSRKFRSYKNDWQRPEEGREAGAERVQSENGSLEKESEYVQEKN